MEHLQEWLEFAWAPCATFGPLFLVWEGKPERYTRFLRYVGLAMVIWSLTSMQLRLSIQNDDISVLKLRLQLMEDRKH